MGQTLTEIAKMLKNANKKVQLIYAFNGTGKTRLSREFKQLVDSERATIIEEETAEEAEEKSKILYYNAFTEDLFYWDNDLDADVDRRLKIQPNGFTDMVLKFLKDQGQDGRIISHFQRYTNPFITPKFSPDFSEVTFSIQRGNNENLENIKISKGEESNFIWCVFYSLVEHVVEILNESELNNRATEQFNDLKYVFVDDPVSSLDDNHLIELAVNLAELIKKSNGLNFVISTHNTLFYNVLYNELNSKVCYMLSKNEDGTFGFVEKKGDSNKSFSYHLFLKNTIDEAIKTSSIQKYHFILLRNLYEKTAIFLGYPQWSDLLPDDKQTYYNRVIQFTSHSTLSNEVVAEPTEPEKQIVNFLLDHLITNFNYWKETKNGNI